MYNKETNSQNTWLKAEVERKEEVVDFAIGYAEDTIKIAKNIFQDNLDIQSILNILVYHKKNWKL